MNLAKSLTMAIVLVLGLLYVWEYELRNPDDTPVVDELVFSGIAKADVQRFTIVQKGVSFPVQRQEKNPSIWEMRRPEHAPVDLEVADQLIEDILKLEVKNALSKEETDPDPSIYGLEPPELLILLKGEFGRRVVSFGKEHKVTGRRYVQPEHDSRIYLVEGSVFTNLSEKTSKLRNMRPFHFSTEQVEVLTVLNPDPTVQPLLFKQRRGLDGQERTWHLTLGEREVPADKWLIERELRDLASAQAVKLEDNVGLTQLPLFGLAEPRIVIQLSLSEKNDYGNDTIVLRLGRGVALKLGDAELTIDGAKIAHFTKLSVDPTVYQLKRAFYRDWLQPPEHFFHKQPFVDTAVDTITKATLTLSGKDPLQYPCETTTQLDSEKLIEALHTFKVLTYTRLQEADFQKHLANSTSLQLTVSIGEEEVELRIGQEVAQGQAAGAPNEPSAAPRFSSIRRSSGSQLLAVTSSAHVEELNKNIEKLVADSVFCPRQQATPSSAEVER